MSPVPSDQRHLIVFVKAPRPGFVKTRLASALGRQGACDAYRQIVARLLESLEGFRSVDLRFTPDEAAPEIVSWLRPGWRAVPQGPGDLGARLARAFHESLGDAGAQKALVVGSDCPFLTPADLESGFAALDESDLVLGPARDGGYWLIGLRRDLPALFPDIPWSTDRVLESTLFRARGLRLRVKQLRLLSDIDTLDDWNQWLPT